MIMLVIRVPSFYCNILLSKKSPYRELSNVLIYITMVAITIIIYQEILTDIAVSLISSFADASFSLEPIKSAPDYPHCKLDQ